jgi:hypothetical protein
VGQQTGKKNETAAQSNLVVCERQRNKRGDNKTTIKQSDNGMQQQS